MARVYLTGPRHSPQERGVFEVLDPLIQTLGHSTVVSTHDFPIDGVDSPEAARAAFNRLVKGIESCDAVVAILDGPDVDSGVTAELAYAYALRRPILGLRSDSRTTGFLNGINLQIFGMVNEVVRVVAWDIPILKPVLESFLLRVRVFAGTLVRDAVPKLLEAEGQSLKFRAVDPNEYPAVLKRKLVETIRKLEESEFGVEQEEIADVLELLETLINLRKYDKDSLRSIKEGKWRKRGGFERGLLLDEEPKLSSR